MIKKAKIMEPLEELKMLIDAWEIQENRGNLTTAGIEYVAGMRAAYRILTKQ